MSAKENKQLIRQTIEAWNTVNGDVGKMRSFLVQGPEETLDLITTDNGVSHKGSICWAEGVGNIEERWTEMSTVLWILTLKSAYLVAKQLW